MVEFSNVYIKIAVVSFFKDGYEKVVTKYVDSIKEILSEQILEDEAVTYTGDEIQKIDPVKLQRLKSVSGDRDFYEIDFNNDGNPEYISKTRESQSYIRSDVYRFEEKKTVLLKYSLKNHRFMDYKNGMSQIWFKELDGKIFTCKLIARGDISTYPVGLGRWGSMMYLICFFVILGLTIYTAYKMNESVRLQEVIDISRKKYKGITDATIYDIEERWVIRSMIYYYPQLVYIVDGLQYYGGGTIYSSQKNDFIVGAKIQIKYDVDNPELFMLADEEKLYKSSDGDKNQYGYLILIMWVGYFIYLAVGVS